MVYINLNVAFAVFPSSKEVSESTISAEICACLLYTSDAADE